MSIFREKLSGIVLTALLILTSSLVFADVNVIRGPYLQDQRPESIVVVWRTDVPTYSEVAFRKADQLDEKDKKFMKSFSSVRVLQHEVLLNELEPNTKYEYTIKYLGENLGEPGTFWTGAGPDLAEFSFVFMGDHRNYPDKHKLVADAIIREGIPPFYVDSGDLTGDGESKNDPWDREFFGPAAELMRNSCNFPAIGNHEVVRKSPLVPYKYFEYFVLPSDSSGTEAYYTFTYGTAQFFILDVYSTSYEIDSKQWKWLKRKLKESTAKWRFAAFHYPVYIQRTQPTVSYGKTAIREHLVPLFEQYGVSMVIGGDSHFYQRSEVNGVTYVTAAGGGAPLYTPGTEMDYIRASNKDYHFCKVEIKGDEMTLKAIDKDSKLFDTFTMAPREPQLAPKPIVNFVDKLTPAELKPGMVVIVESKDADGNVTAEPAYREEGPFSSSTVKSQVEGLSGKGSRFSMNDKADARAVFAPKLPADGLYEVYITCPLAGSVDASNSYFEIETNDGMITGDLELSYRTAGDKWMRVGLFDLDRYKVTFTMIEFEDAPDRFYADAVKFIQMK